MSLVAGVSGLVTPSVGLLPRAAVGPVGPRAGGGGTLLEVTVGTNGANPPSWGFFSGSYGSVDPASYQSINIRLVNYSEGLTQWAVCLFQLGLAQDFFTEVQIELPSGGPLVFETANTAAFNPAAPQNSTCWVWSDPGGSTWSNQSGQVFGVTIR